MPLDKKHIKLLSFRLWWHLDNSNELDASFDIATEFYNLVKEDYPIRTRKQLNPNKVKFEIYNQSKNSKFELVNDEFIFTIENIDANESDIISFKKVALEKRELILSILKRLKIKNNHLHQDFALIYFYKINEISEVSSKFEEIGINFDLSFQKEKNQLLNLNISSQFKNGDLGKTSYEIATGIYEKEKGVIIQVQHSSPKLNVEKNHLDKWINEIINLNFNLHQYE